MRDKKNCFQGDYSKVYFETIKCKDQEIFNLDYHKKRMARTVSINFNLEEYIYILSDHLVKCKIVYDKNGIIDILYSPYEERSIKSFKLIKGDKIEYPHKSTDRKEIDNLYKKRDEADEIIIIKNGLVTDTSIANIAIEDNGQWYTPRLPLLLGTTRERYLDKGILKEKDITPEMLKSSKKIALLNAMVDFKVLDNFTLIDA